MESLESAHSLFAMNENNEYYNVSSANVTDDREAHSKFWIAAYTRSRGEKKAATEIGKMNIETYVPIQQIIRQWNDRKKKVDVVVIPMVIFAHVTPDDIITVKKYPLITKVLSFPGERQAAEIPEQQILSLKFMLNEAETPVTFIHPTFSLTDTVRVTRGKLSGLIGKVHRITEGKTKLVVSIDLLGGAMVEINSSSLEVLK